MNTQTFFSDVGEGITAIDTEYVRPSLDASHLLIDSGRAAFIDTGTNHSVPNLMATLAAKNIAIEQVDTVFLTHIHLDHAGGAGLLMQQLPNATAVIHPRGAKHMANPEKLIAGTKAVYGEAQYKAMYGDLIAIDAHRIKQPEDGERIAVGKRQFELIYTEGHARHHYCLMDLDNRIGFSGDSFGSSYRETDTDKGEFIMPITSPVHFDPKAAHIAINRIMSYQPQALYLTHYSRVNNTQKLAEDMHKRIDAYVDIALRHQHDQERGQLIRNDLRDYIFQQLDEHGFDSDTQQRDALLGGDIMINAQGLEVWLDQLSRNGVT